MAAAADRLANGLHTGEAIGSSLNYLCWECGNDLVERVSACSRCQFATYCGKECFQKNLPAHRRFCDLGCGATKAMWVPLMGSGPPMPAGVCRKGFCDSAKKRQEVLRELRRPAMGEAIKTWQSSSFHPDPSTPSHFLQTSPGQETPVLMPITEPEMGQLLAKFPKKGVVVQLHFSPGHLGTAIVGSALMEEDFGRQRELEQLASVQPEGSSLCKLS